MEPPRPSGDITLADTTALTLSLPWAGVNAVLGSSRGAWHAALVALHDPQRLASATLIEPNGVITIRQHDQLSTPAPATA